MRMTIKLQLPKLLLIVILGFVLLNSCSDEPSMSYPINTATVIIGSDNNSYKLVLDNNLEITPNSYELLPDSLVNSRAIIGYKLTTTDSSALQADIYSLDYILTKTVIDLVDSNAATIGNSKLNVLGSPWIGDHYLNVYFSYLQSGKVVHSINLVKNTTITPSSDGKIHLELRHNSRGDQSSFSARGMAAFDLSPYEYANSDSVNLVIKVLDYVDGDKDYNVTYYYKNNPEVAIQTVPSYSSLGAKYE